MRKKIIFLPLFFVASVILSGCGGGGGSSNSSSGTTTRDIAITHIYEYAQNNSNAPTIEDYINAGVSGVTQENLDEVNGVVAGLTKEKVDTKEEIQAIVDSLQINIQPTADAGADKSVQVNQSITITGSGSDRDGTITSYEWKEGNIVLANTISFDYIPTTAGTHVLTFTVMDDDGAMANDTIIITVSNAPVPNQAPTANAGADKSVQVDQSITITGSGSDSDGSIASYQWKEGNTVLSNSASFTYNAPSSAGSHTLTLTVTDNDGDTASNTMVITVTAPAANQAPTANAGADKSVQVDQSITITGSGSDSD
jgi:hypothetical protein